MNKKSNGFTLVELLVVIGILGILMGALFPAISAAMLSANLSACSMRGRNLYVGITTSNTEREAAGLSSVWPKSSKNKSDDTEDIAGKGPFGTSTEYFKELFDLENFGSDTWSPYVSGVDVGVLSGSGVPGFTGKNIQPQNVTWLICSGLTDEMEDVLPVLATRNVAYQQLKTDSYDGTSTTEVPVGKAGGGESDTPFSNKAWVLVRKGGAAQSIKLKYSKLNVIYNRQSFTIPTDAEFSYIPVGL